MDWIFSTHRKDEKVKVKVKTLCFFFNWEPSHEGLLGEWRYSSTHSLTSALNRKDEKALKILVGNTSFSTVFTRARHCTLSSASWNQTTLSRPICLYYYMPLEVLSSIQVFPTKILYAFLISLIHPTRPSHIILLDFITLIILKNNHYATFSLLLLLLLFVQILPSARRSQTPQSTRRKLSAMKIETGPAWYPMGTRGSFPGSKAAGREADHLPPSSTEVKEWVELQLHCPIRLYGAVLS
jgi:hypothetical protein